MGSVPLRVALETTLPGNMYDNRLLGNAGNEAQFTLYLLQALAKGCQEFSSSNK